MNEQEIEVQSLEYSLFSIPWSSALAIVSPTSIDKMDNECQKILQSRKSKWITSHEVTYDDVLVKISQLESTLSGQLLTIVGIGGGTAIDYAKYVAHHNDLYCIAIPSMLSTNVFATNKVAVIDSNGKHTEDGKLPDSIMVDWGYLHQSDRENLYGLVDVFSIYNALRDWLVANVDIEVPIKSFIFSRAIDLLKSALVIAHDHIKGHGDIREIFHVVREAGYITNDYGSGRPESGSEHIFASALESVMPIPHALAVTLGIHVMEFHWQQTGYERYNTMSFSDLPFSQLGLIDDINALQISRDTLIDVVTHLQPRSDKYTAMDRVVRLDFFNHHQDKLLNWLADYGFKFK